MVRNVTSISSTRERSSPRLRVACFTLLPATVLGCFASASSNAPLVVEHRSPAIDARGVVQQPVGIETLGGVFTPLLEPGCTTPCVCTRTFSTATDDQHEILIWSFRGDARRTADAVPLGKFRVEQIPSMPRGRPQIVVRFAAEHRDLTIEAADATTHRPYTIVRVEE